MQKLESEKIRCSKWLNENHVVFTFNFCTCENYFGVLSLIVPISVDKSFVYKI